MKEISADLQSYLNDIKLERKNILRIRLTVEEILLNIMEHWGTEIKVSFGIGRRFGRQILRIYMDGTHFDAG